WEVSRIVGTDAKLAAAAQGFREIAVPGFFRWARDNGYTLPSWLTFDMMGRTTKDGAPLLYTNGKRLWSRFDQAMREMKRDFNPVWDSLVKGQPGLPGDQKLPSGQSGEDAMDYLLNGLYATTPAAAAESVLTVEEGEFLQQPGGEDANGDREGQQNGSVDAAGQQQGEGPAGAGQQQDGGGAASQQQIGGLAGVGEQQDGEGTAFPQEGRGGVAGQQQSGGGAAGQQPDEQEPSSPEEDRECDGKGEGGRAGGLKQELADKDAEAGDGALDCSGDDAPKYPDRPKNWIHQYLLIYCFIGRPSSSQDQDLRTARKTSGPSDRPIPKKRKGGPSASGKGGKGRDGVVLVEAPAGNLASTAIRMFTGAGQAQSRAQVQKEQAAVAAASAQETARQAQTTHSGKLVKAVEALSAAVAAKQALDIQAAGRACEAAARDRKDSAIKNLKGELEFSDPASPRYAELRNEIRALFSKPVTDFMD
ncbi:unnamed protein product, partial [Scytosiphon promiscuus]